MPEGGQLRIGLERTRDLPPSILPETGVRQWVSITVTDTGTGIPPDVRPHIFDPFFSTKAPDQGTGLGLSQVYGIVTQHDGHIDVTTEVGQGTTFALYLPALVADRPQTPIQETQNLVRGQGQTILVVEDNAATREALASALEMLDYRVLEASNGQEALAILENGRAQCVDDPSTLTASSVSKQEIALVLSDVTMPKMGGRALFQALRQRGLNVNVVLVTGNPLQDELESLRTQGLSGWLLKPPKLEQLSQMVAQALEKKKTKN
jgi:CheY-like chemotaxis protein